MNFVGKVLIKSKYHECCSHVGQTPPGLSSEESEPTTPVTP